MNTYYAELSNAQGCVVDRITGTSIKALKDWARERGDLYHWLTITQVDAASWQSMLVFEGRVRG